MLTKSLKVIALSFALVAVAGCDGFHALNGASDPGTTIDVGGGNFTPDDGAGTTPPASDGSTIAIMKSIASSKCLDDSSDLLVQNTCTGKLSQKFKITPTTGSLYTIENINTGLCLTSMSDGSQVGEDVCNEALPEQNFLFTQISSGIYKAQTQLDNSCLTLNGASQDNGAIIDTESCATVDSQKFSIPGFTPSNAPVVHAI